MTTSSAMEPLAPPPAGLSQLERVINIFMSPTKTFQDILRSNSWWMPLLLVVVLSAAQAWVIDQKVGFDRVAENQIHASPKSEDRINQLPPDQKAKQMEMSAKITRVVSYVAPVMLLIMFALYALIVWAAFNFGFGAQTTFMQVYAVSWYAALPYLLRSVLVIITLLAGGDTDSFNQQNPIGTNAAYYMPEAAVWLKTLLMNFDAIAIWSTILMVIGMATIAKKSITQSAVIIGGLWLLTVILSTGMAAAFS